MDRRILSATGLGLLGLGAVVAAWWVFRVDTGPTARVAAPSSATSTYEDAQVEPTSPTAKRGKRPRRGKSPQKAKSPVKAKSPAKAKVAKVPLPTDDELSEMAWARKEYREQRVQEMNGRLDAYAHDAGWNSASTEEVRHLLIDSMDRITRQLSRVDNGQVSWHQHKHAVRQFRERRAERLKKLIGPDDFEAFTEAMGFERFNDEEPTAGRLNRRAP